MESLLFDSMKNLRFWPFFFLTALLKSLPYKKKTPENVLINQHALFDMEK